MMLAFRVDGHSRSETVSDPIPTSRSRIYLFPILQASVGLYF